MTTQNDQDDDIDVADDGGENVENADVSWSITASGLRSRRRVIIHIDIRLGNEAPAWPDPQIPLPACALAHLVLWQYLEFSVCARGARVARAEPSSIGIGESTYYKCVSIYLDIYVDISDNIVISGI